MRLTKTTLAVLLTVGITSCSGGGGNLMPQTTPQTTAGQPPSTSQQLSGKSASSMSPNTASTYLTVTGSVVGFFSGGFTIKTTSGCSGGGDLHIYIQSNTTYYGSKPTVGVATKVYGQGSCTALAAITVTTSTAGTYSVPKHVLTADYLGKPYGTTSIAYSSAAPYLTWAQTGIYSATAIHNAGIKTELYADPNATANDGDPLYTSNQNTFAHSCSGSRISYSYDGHVFYVMAIGGSAMQSLFANWVNAERSVGHFDAVFEDNAGPWFGLPEYPCNYSNSQWITYGEQLNSASPIPVITGGLEDLYNKGVSLTVNLLDNGNTIGGNYEHCFSDTHTPKMHTWVWQAMEATEINVANRNKLFECQARNTNSASSATDARIYTLASFLLGYNPRTSILWEQFSTPSGFHVMPESGLVALSPKVTPSSLSSVHMSGGTYARQFGACYYRGSSVGACAVVVNPDTVAHPFPFSGYHHTLYLSGSGVVDGGKAYTTGSAPPSSVPADEAYIVFP
jgi:hypothetical protein